MRYSETDKMGVVYHANYLIWCEIGRTELIRKLGPAYSEIEATGTILPVTDARMRYHKGAKYDELVKVITKIHSVRSRSVTFEYEIMGESGELLVSASTVLVAVGPDGKTRSMPINLRKALEGAIEG